MNPVRRVVTLLRDMAGAGEVKFYVFVPSVDYAARN